MTLLTRDALIDWLRQQPADEEYVWQDPVFCLMGRYLADNSSRWGDVGYSDMPHYEEIAGQKPWTFGAALERAEALKQLPSPAAFAAPVQEEKSRELVTVDAE
jgi:hypothetical protein